MSLQTTPSDRKPPVRQRLGASLKQALDNMALKGMRWQDAAIAADYSTASMWRALQSSHAQSYLRQQREVFRSSLIDPALMRMVALSEQSDNLTAAVAATRTLLNESDQEHSAGSHRAAPGLVVQIINSHALPSVRTLEHEPAQVIDNVDDVGK